MTTQYAGIPVNIVAGLDRYVHHGLDTGGFLHAVLCNDLFGAVARADSESLLALPEIVRYIFNDLPNGCWGSEEKVAAWQARFLKNRSVAL